MADVESSRVVLITFTAVDGTPSAGSGLLVSGQFVLTADHIAAGFSHQIVREGHTHEATGLLRTGSLAVDLAILTLKRPLAGVDPMSCAAVNRKLITEIPRCRAVGFPRWKRDGHVRGSTQVNRGSVQVNGAIPTGEGLIQTADAGLREGFLTLVGDRLPTAPPIQRGPVTKAGTSTPWGGMSGAAVTHEGAVLGVVRSLNLAEDGRSLTITPLTNLDQLQDRELARKFWEALGVSSPARLPLLPARPQPQTGSGRNAVAAACTAFGVGSLLGQFLARHPAPAHNNGDETRPNTREAHKVEIQEPHGRTTARQGSQHHGTHYGDHHPGLPYDPGPHSYS
jgi:hypothetical protein